MRQTFILLAIAIAVSTTALARSTVDWPQFHMNAQRSGYNPSETTLNPTNVGHLQNAWVGVMGDIVDLSSPAVAGGMVFIGSFDGKLYAFGAGGCQGGMCLPQWTGDTGGSIASSPAVSNGIVYIGSQHL